MWPMWPENMAKGWLWQILSSEDEVFCIKGPLFGSDDGAVAFYPGPHLLRVTNRGSCQISGIGYILVTKYAFQRVAASCLYSVLDPSLIVMSIGVYFSFIRTSQISQIGCTMMIGTFIDSAIRLVICLKTGPKRDFSSSNALTFPFNSLFSLSNLIILSCME